MTFAKISFVAFLLIVVFGCGDDPSTPPAPPPDPEIFVTESWHYQNNRFFRLDLPQDDHTVHARPDVPGRARSIETIIRESVRVYEFVGAGAPQSGDVQYVVAVRDTTGRWDGAAIQDQLANHTEGRMYGELWRSVPHDLLLDNNAHIVAIDLGIERPWATVLAVTYEMELADGTRLRVGDVPGVDDENRVEFQGELYYRMKLLKTMIPEPFTWQYVLRNIYSLGVANIDPARFHFRIELRALLDHPDIDPYNGIDFFRLFGLDREDMQSRPYPDGIVDIHVRHLFDLERGLLIFPLDFPEPFNASQERYESHVDGSLFSWDDSSLPENLTPEIYDWQINPTTLDRFGRFNLVSVIY